MCPVGGNTHSLAFKNETQKNASTTKNFFRKCTYFAIFAIPFGAAWATEVTLHLMTELKESMLGNNWKDSQSHRISFVLFHNVSLNPV